MISLEYDHTLRTLDDTTTYIIYYTLTTYLPQCDNFATTYDKCDTKDTLCDDCDDTCAMVLKNFRMSVTNFYIVMSNYLHEDNPLKPPKQSYTHYMTVNMRKYDIYRMKRKGGMTLAICKQ